MKRRCSESKAINLSDKIVKFDLNKPTRKREPPKGGSLSATVNYMAEREVHSKGR